MHHNQLRQDFHPVEIWDDTVNAVSVSTTADKWLSDFLQKECRLVTMPPISKRHVDANYNTGEDIVSFADAYPFLIIGEASMQDLNRRITETRNPNSEIAPPSVFGVLEPILFLVVA